VGVILAIDVGNTNIVVGAYDKDRLIRTWRLVTVHDRTEDELAVMLDGLLAQEDLALDEIDALVLGSVVPGFPWHWLPGLAWPWYVPLGTGVTVAVGMLASLVGRSDSRMVGWEDVPS